MHIFNVFVVLFYSYIKNKLNRLLFCIGLSLKESLNLLLFKCVCLYFFIFINLCNNVACTYVESFQF